MPHPGGIVELPSFTNEDTSRPTVQMPPLGEHRPSPVSIDDAFDGGLVDESIPGDDPTDRVRIPTLLGMGSLATSRPPQRGDE